MVLKSIGIQWRPTNWWSTLSRPLLGTLDALQRVKPPGSHTCTLSPAACSGSLLWRVYTCAQRWHAPGAITRMMTPFVGARRRITRRVQECSRRCFWAGKLRLLLDLVVLYARVNTAVTSMLGIKEIREVAGDCWVYKKYILLAEVTDSIPSPLLQIPRDISRENALLSPLCRFLSDSLHI